MNLLTYISAITYLLFTIASIKKIKRIPDNLSDTYYIWQKPKYTFSFMLATISLSMLPKWIYFAEKYDCEYLMYVAGIGMTIVCLIPDYKTNLWKFVTHIVSAYTTGFAAAVFILIISGIGILLTTLAIALILYLIFDKNKKSTFEFWLEFIVLSALFVTFITN